MDDPTILVAIIGALVSAVSAALVYLGTRSSSRVSREREIGEREDRYVERLELDRARLETLLAACKAREAERDAAASARLAAGMVVDVAVSQESTNKAADVVRAADQEPKQRREGNDDPS